MGLMVGLLVSALLVSGMPQPGVPGGAAGDFVLGIPKALWNTQFGGYGGYGGNSGFGGYGWGGYGGYGGYGYGSGVVPVANPYAAYANQPAQAAPRKNFMWVCLEDIFPQSVSLQAGLPPKAANLLSRYMTHAYVLHGPSAQESVAWQLSLDTGQEFWMKLLNEAKSMDTENVISWGEAMAAKVDGKTKVSSTDGSHVFIQSKKCFRTKEEVTCDSQQLRSFASTYHAAHPNFNLLSDNCAMFACSALQHCSKDATCQSNSCAHEIMYQPMENKSPMCSTQEEKHNTGGMGALITGLDAGSWPQLKEFMPMHDPEVMLKMKAMMASS